MKKILTLLVAAISFAACQKIDLGEDPVSTDTQSKNDATILPIGKGKVVLSVQESSNASAVKVSYPVTIYVFNSSDSCVTRQIFTKSDESMELTLDPAQYTLYAIGGATETDYTIPSQADAKPTSVIALNKGKKHTDLMTSSDSILLEEGKTVESTLQMKRNVAQIAKASVSNVPTDVTSVSVYIASLPCDIKINGSTSSMQRVDTLNLTKQSDGTTWENTDGLYVLPKSSVSPKLIYQFVQGSTVCTYTETLEPFEKNQQITLNATYTAAQKLISKISCTIQGVAWGENKTVSVNILEGTKGHGNQDAEVMSVADFESPSSINVDYKVISQAYYRVAKRVLGDKTYAMGLTIATDCSGFSTKITDQAELKTKMEAKLDNFTRGTSTIVKSWRLPTEVEMKYIVKNLSTINQRIKTLVPDDKNAPLLTKYNGEKQYYYYTKSNGDISAMDLSTGKDYSDFDTSSSNFRVRGITIVGYNNPSE